VIVTVITTPAKDTIGKGPTGPTGTLNLKQNVSPMGILRQKRNASPMGTQKQRQNAILSDRLMIAVTGANNDMAGKMRNLIEVKDKEESSSESDSDSEEDADDIQAVS
jgi:hypothetical protein